ncbi:5'-3' exonuclease [Arthrobacter sp. H20]|uniref:5'-3' exonuclease n=1 Tax=Arthrobacter sp. H20 TaxID=1267981 RepID=UPI00056BCF5C|nr:5'-3' exonuclease [Arthrobacter sp. H20]
MLLDTASLYFRAFYGLPDSLRAPDGTPVNAVRGLLDMIARLVTDYQPTHLIACWDDDWRPAWRVNLIPSYKAHRMVKAIDGGVDVEEVPPGLVAQVPMIREALAAFGITVIGAAQHEADDVIGSLAAQADSAVDIVTGDRDLFQLINDDRDVRVIYTARGMSRLEVLTDATVVSKYSVLPGQYADFAALRGDSSDGLPGVPGIGDKTAASLLQEFVDLDGVIAAAKDSASSMSASMRARITKAADYLAVAPTVVNVVSDLHLGEFEATLQPLSAEQLARIDQFTSEWNLGGSTGRALKALGNGTTTG